MARIENAVARVETGAPVLVFVGDRLQRAAPLVRLRGQRGGQLVAALFQFGTLLLRRLQRVGGGRGKLRQLHLFAAHLAQRHPDRVQVSRQGNHDRVGGLGGLAHRSQPQVPAARRQQRFQFRDRGYRHANRGERRIAAARHGSQIDSQRRPRGDPRDTLVQRLQVGNHLVVFGHTLLQVGPVRRHVDRCHEPLELGGGHGRR